MIIFGSFYVIVELFRYLFKFGKEGEIIRRIKIFLLSNF